MQADYDDARAVAQLPNLDIEILHRRPWRGDGEMLSITLRATPSFDAFFKISRSKSSRILDPRDGDGLVAVATVRAGDVVTRP